MPKLVIYHQILKNSLKWVKTQIRSQRLSQTYNIPKILISFKCLLANKQQSENELIPNLWRCQNAVQNQANSHLSHSNSSLKSTVCTEHKYPGSHKLEQVWYIFTYVPFYTSTVKLHTIKITASQALSQYLNI